MKWKYKVTLIYNGSYNSSLFSYKVMGNNSWLPNKLLAEWGEYILVVVVVVIIGTLSLIHSHWHSQ